MSILCELAGESNVTGRDDTWYCSQLGLVYRCPVVAEVFLGVAESEPPEARVQADAGGRIADLFLCPLSGII